MISYFRTMLYIYIFKWGLLHIDALPRTTPDNHVELSISVYRWVPKNMLCAQMSQICVRRWGSWHVCTDESNLCAQMSPLPVFEVTKNQIPWFYQPKERTIYKDMSFENLGSKVSTSHESHVWSVEKPIQEIHELRAESRALRYGLCDARELCGLQYLGFWRFDGMG